MSNLNEIRPMQPIRPMPQDQRRQKKKTDGRKKNRERNKPNSHTEDKGKVDEYI